jgi:hypothetical protein
MVLSALRDCVYIHFTGAGYRSHWGTIVEVQKRRHKNDNDDAVWRNA